LKPARALSAAGMNCAKYGHGIVAATCCGQSKAKALGWRSPPRGSKENPSAGAVDCARKGWGIIFLIVAARTVVRALGTGRDLGSAGRRDDFFGLESVAAGMALMLQFFSGVRLD
jgi:hypothetical protein